MVNFSNIISSTKKRFDKNEKNIFAIEMNLLIKQRNTYVIFAQ